MGMQPAVCANCGAGIDVDDVNLNGFAECKYCHTFHKVIDIITIDGLPTAKTHLITAQNALADSELEKAMKFFNMTIEIKPNCHEAWWGLYICQRAIDEYYGYEDKYGNGGPIVKANIMESTIQKYARRAIKYSPENVACNYKAAIKNEEDFINAVKNSSRQIPLNTKRNGCYIATAVYGSYNCEEVVQLRRFRDNVLAKYAAGRLFIKFYYFISPMLAKHISPDSFIGEKIRAFLDYLRVRV